LNRIPTKDNLLRRTVVPLDDCYCIEGCGVVEDRNHLFVQCEYVMFSVDYGIWWPHGWDRILWDLAFFMNKGINFVL